MHEVEQQTAVLLSLGDPPGDALPGYGTQDGGQRHSMGLATSNNEKLAQQHRDGFLPQDAFTIWRKMT